MGSRRAAIDVVAFCDELDQLIGPIVAEVMISQCRFRMGKQDAARLCNEKSQATVREIVDLLVESERFSGIGSTRVTVPENPEQPVEIEVSTPCVTKTSGAAKFFIFGYWSGALSVLMKREMKTANVIYDEQADMVRCQIVPR